MPFKIVRNDITKMQVDVIVNTANEAPIYSTGTDTAIYEAAGVEKLLAARRKIGFLEEGEVAITPGFKLPAKYIIHAVSPYYIDGTYGEAEKLRCCYEKSLALALEHHCESIAFPLIATGGFGYPKAEGLEIALNVIHTFLMKEEMMIYLVVFDKESVRLSGKIFDDIEAFIDENYVAEKQIKEYGFYNTVLEEHILTEPDFTEPDFTETDFADSDFTETDFADLDEMRIGNAATESDFAIQRMSAPVFKAASAQKRSLEELVNNIGETFQQRLFRLIAERGRNEVSVYKGACKDKKFFYKIRNNENYQPTKHTVFAFAISLQLSMDETIDLLASAGFAFSPSSKFDLIMQYVFEQQIYDRYKIDCILYDFGEEHYFSCDS